MGRVPDGPDSFRETPCPKNKPKHSWERLGSFKLELADAHPLG